MSKRDPWVEELYRCWSHQMLKVAVVLLGNRAVAEEVVHDVFILLLMYREKVETYYHPESWLFRVLYNKINNELRRAKYKYEIPFDPEYHQNIEVEEITKLEDVLPFGLNKQERQILIWYFEDDLSHEEIAERLGCDIHASHMRLYRAKKKCKELLLKEKVSSNSG